MKKFLLLLLSSASSCGTIDTTAGLINKHPRPFVVRTKPSEERIRWGHYDIMLQDSTGTYFTLDDEDICRLYNIGDTIK